MGRTDHIAGAAGLGRRSTKKTWVVAMALAAGLASAGAANATILTFDGAEACGPSVCVESAFITQTYGDTALVDVRFDGTTTNPGLESMRWWSGGYSDLIGVAYFGLAFGQNAPSGVQLIPIAGYQITLNSFDLGSWADARYTTQVTLRGGDGSLISSSGNFLTTGAAHDHFTSGLTRADGFRIEWGPDDFNVGIDNINYTVTRIGGDGVPEPAAWALMTSGFALAGAALRRRRASAASA